MRDIQLLLGIASAVVSALGVITLHAALTWNETPWHGMQELRIRTEGSSTLGFGEHATLIAEGKYGTSTVPVRAAWDVPQGITLASFDCIDSPVCTITAGDTPGLVTVRATFDARSALANLTIRSTGPRVTVERSRVQRLLARIRSFRYSIVSR